MSTFTTGLVSPNCARSDGAAAAGVVGMVGGQMADLDPILEIATRHKLLVIEDAAQSMGASWGGRMIGSFGDQIGRAHV